jgi:DNA invertase Pin-like site-specific DNA recombinase
MPSTNGHGPKRAVLYARVSTDEQARSVILPRTAARSFEGACRSRGL